MVVPTFLSCVCFAYYKFLRVGYQQYINIHFFALIMIELKKLA